MRLFSSIEEDVLYLVFEGLGGKFTEPGERAVGPALGMESEHYMAGQLAYTGNDVVGGAEVEVVRGHDFVADAVLFAVPAAAGIGEVGYFCEIDIEIGLADDIQGPVVVFLPDEPVVVP